MTEQELAILKRKMEADDLAGVGELLEQNRGGLPALSSSARSSPTQFLAAIRSVNMADLLLQNGLTVSMVSECWGSGFWLNKISPVVAEHLIDRGALLTPHAAAGLGLVARLRALLDHRPELIHAKGGDGGRPLHLSRNLETAQLLVERGAELDAKDDDHDSTAAQWRIGDVTEVTRGITAHRWDLRSTVAWWLSATLMLIFRVSSNCCWRRARRSKNRSIRAEMQRSTP